MAKRGAVGRLERLLSMVPWIAERDGPTIDEICSTFEVSREALLDDLNVVWVVGLHPFTPDELVDVTIDGDRVWIRYAEYFARPLQLTPEQGLALVTAGAGVRSLEGVSADGPLDRGLAKLGVVLGVTPGEAVDIEVGGVETDTLALLRTATEELESLTIDYYSYGRDERSERIVDPLDVTFTNGQWYLSAWCHRSEAERFFRVDRVRRVERTGENFTRRVSEATVGEFAPDNDHQRATLLLAPPARWVVETYPCEHVEELDDGRIRVVLAVAGAAFLERLLLSLGPNVEVADDHHGAVASQAAIRVLARYQT